MNPNLRRPTVADGGAAVNTYCARIEQMLCDGRPFLLGAVASIADFSAAQSVWFLRLAPPVATVLDAYPALAAWYARMTEFGHGSMSKASAAEAIAVAAEGRTVAPVFHAEEGLAEGAEVSVTPTDYAHDAVTGRLVGLTRDEVVVARTDERAGRVHVHFPRIGFQIKSQQPA